MAIYCEWRAYIGPRYRPASDTYYYPWHQIEIDAPTDMTSAATTLDSAMASGGTSASLTSGTNFATTGGVWIGPVSAGQGWEYVDYHTKSGNTLPNLIRESTETREHNGAHGIGAVVRQFWPLDTNDGALQFVNELDDNLAANDWRATISGVAFPQAALRNNHLIAIQTRTTPGAAWGNFIVGFVRAPRAVDTYEHTGQWKIEIVSAAAMLRRTQVASVRTGAFSLSSACSATSSTPLSSPRHERDSGDYTAAEPDLSAESVLDGDLTTPWIADRHVGQENTTVDNYRMNGQIGPSQLYINPPAGYGDGYRWIEITKIDGFPARVPTLWVKATGTEYQLLREWVSGLKNSSATDDEYIIICEDKDLFARDNPSQEAARIHALYDSSNGDARAWLSRFDPAGGAFGFKTNAPIDQYEMVVCWGTQTSKPFGSGATVQYYDDEWDGNAAPAPGEGETIRREHISAATPEYAMWETGDAQSPGYTIDNDDQVWLRVDLPGMDLRLRDDIDTDTTTIYVVDAAGRATTDGLPSAATLVIGEDQIAYTGKTTEALTGVTGIGSAHAEGDTIYLLAVSAYITDAYPIGSIQLSRSGGTIYPQEFTIYASPYSTARNPGESNWTDDYPWSDQITGHSAATYTAVADDMNPGAAAVRARTIVITFERMTSDPARPRLSELDLYLASSFFDGDTWIAADSPEALIATILQNGGISSGAITTYESANNLDGLATDTGGAFGVAADLADYAGSRIHVQRDSDITLSANSLWTTAIGGYTPDRTWTAADVSAVDFAWLAASSVAQIRLAWRNHDGSDQGTEDYPSTPSDEGKTVDVGPLILADATAAALAARKRYYLAQYPYEIVIELAGGNTDPEPGEIHRLNGWTLDRTVGAIDRTYLIRSVEHSIEYDPEAGHPILATVLSGIEIDREHL